MPGWSANSLSRRRYSARWRRGISSMESTISSTFPRSTSASMGLAADPSRAAAALRRASRIVSGSASNARSEKDGAPSSSSASRW